jgi:hypothetical protein
MFCAVLTPSSGSLVSSYKVITARPNLSIVIVKGLPSLPDSLTGFLTVYSPMTHR